MTHTTFAILKSKEADDEQVIAGRVSTLRHSELSHVTARRRLSIHLHRAICALALASRDNHEADINHITPPKSPFIENKARRHIDNAVE